MKLKTRLVAGLMVVMSLAVSSVVSASTPLTGASAFFAGGGFKNLSVVNNLKYYVDPLAKSTFGSDINKAITAYSNIPQVNFNYTEVSWIDEKPNLMIYRSDNYPQLGGLALTLMFLLNGNQTYSHSQLDEVATNSKQENTKDCFVVDEYGDELRLNDIRYLQNPKADNKGLEKGKKIGEVMFKVNGNVCLRYNIKNGDATWVEIGTPIYQVQGYAETYRLYADGRIYEAIDSPNAKKLGDIFDVAGKVKKVTLEYYKDNANTSNYDIYSADFSEQDSKLFADNFLMLEYVKKNEIAERNEYVIRFLLQDNTSFHVLYWPEQNVFFRSNGNEAIKNLVKKYVPKMQKVPLPTGQ
ncbi:hypothetical protein [Brevibacillus reuszeri]|uniref:hypothetical protein n=1 Tax=Brevibacillus reuszeri TaxID=54915 RepID=UPI003D1BF2C7